MKKLLSIILAAFTALSLCACADMGEPAGSGDAPEEQYPTYTVTANYDYGMHVPNRATMLYSYSTLFFTLPEGFDPPVAGDEFTVSYTGQLLIQETYPSTVVITGGEIVSVTAEPAVIRTVRYNAADQTLTLLDDNGEDVKIKGEIVFPEYAIVSQDGEYLPLHTLASDRTLYGSVSPTDGEKDGGITFSGLYTVNPRPITDEAKIRQAGDEIVKSRYGISDLSAYKLRIDEHADGSKYHLYYELYIGEHKTDEEIRVQLSTTLQCLRVSYLNQGDYSRFLKNATSEAVSAAEDRLRTKIGNQEGGSGFYLQIDQEGYLCLAVEFIVSIDPSEQDESVGCGDHKHVFYTERICNAD